MQPRWSCRCRPPPVDSVDIADNTAVDSVDSHLAALPRATLGAVTAEGAVMRLAGAAAVAGVAAARVTHVPGPAAARAPHTPPPGPGTRGVIYTLKHGPAVRQQHVPRVHVIQVTYITVNCIWLALRVHVYWVTCVTVCCIWLHGHHLTVATIPRVSKPSLLLSRDILAALRDRCHSGHAARAHIAPPWTGREACRYMDLS